VELRLLTGLLCWRQAAVEELNLIHRHRRIEDLALVISFKISFLLIFSIAASKKTL
jgi:hypothetical protein